MTDFATPHKATPKQWAELEEWATKYEWSSCVVELRDRLAALEAGATCPHILTSDEGTSYCGLAEQGNSSAAPAGGLVELVAAALDGGTESQARAAIHAVAKWFDAIGYGATASILRQELQRHV